MADAPMNLSTYYELADRALSEPSKEAALQALPKAIERGEHSQGLLLWVAAYGPFTKAAPGSPLPSAHTGNMPSEWDEAVAAFVANEPLFETEEAVHVLTDTLLANAQLAQWGGNIDIWARAPEDVKKSLTTPSDVDIAKADTAKAPAPAKKGGGMASAFFGVLTGLGIGALIFKKK